MPSVQSAFGPIVEPGWPSTLPGAPDLAGSYTQSYQNAARLNASINAQQRDFEAQMAHYALQARESKLDRDLAQKKFDLDKHRVDLEYGAKAKSYELAVDRLTKNVEDKERDDKWRERKYQDIFEAKDALMNLDVEVGKNPGEEGYPEAFDAAAEKVRDKLSLLPNQVFNNMRNRKMDSHNKNAVSAWSQFRQEEKSFNDALSQGLYAGKLEGGTGPLDYSQSLEPERDSSWSSWMHPFTPGKPTDRLMVPQPGGGELPVASKVITDLIKRRNDLEERRKHLPHTVHMPESGVYDVGREPAPVEEAKREPNKVYITPNGQPNRWHKPPGALKGQWVPP